MKKTAFIFIILIAGVCLYAQTLSWEIKFLRGIQSESLQNSRPIRMETGEEFQILIKPDTNSYCYLIHVGTLREITILRNAPLIGGIETNIGQFNLAEPSGLETIFVIMSLERQPELERLIREYNLNPNLQQSKDNLSSEIARLQAAVSELGEPSVSIIGSGGVTRSGNQQAQEATRFAEKAMYVRAISIRH